MAKRDKLGQSDIQAFLAAHPGWETAGDALARTFAFDRYPAGIAFAVEVAFAAEKRDHHPDLTVQWGKVRVVWSTHDAGGLTQVDLEMAELTEQLYKA